ncbi:MAG: TIGR00270 family protein [Crenarchaeota archaeon]|nr:TIGR00270 family protein [Thermoproteota archaeon]
MKGQVLYCEMCGQPIRGRAYRAIVEGAEMVLCERCFTSVKAKLAPPPKKSSPKPQRPKGKKVVEYVIAEDYAKRVREARERLGLSRRELGMKVGEHETVIKRIELGRLEPDLELAKKLEKVLGIELIRKVEYEEIAPSGKPSTELTFGDVVVLRKD